MPLKKDSIVGGGMVKANGDFSIDKLPLTELRARISFIGYKPIEQNILLSPKTPEIDLGNLKMETDITILDDVVIEAEKNTMNMGIDRRVFNVDKDLSTKGGTGLDVMKNIPGVTVDGDGNVEVRNQSPTVFIDGRPSTMTLEQIPAEQIDRVEIITNPSVKFDAASKGGIINVVLKKNINPGYNGSISAGAGTNDRYNGSINLNLREGKFNFSASYNYNQGNNPGSGYTNRLNFKNNELSGGFNQNTDQNFGRTFQFGRFATDYQINNRSQLTLGINLNKGIFKQHEKQSFSIFDSSLTTTTRGDRFNRSDNGFDNYTGQLLYRYTFPGSKKEISSDINWNQGTQKNNSNFRTYNFTPEGFASGINPEIQDNTGGGKTNMFTWQLDFTGTLKDSSKIEAGLRTNIKDNSTGQDVFFFNPSTNVFEKSTLISANYRINEQIHASYINYIGKWRSWGYAAGLRYEQTIFRAELIEQNQKFEYLYPQGVKNLGKAIFPALYLSKSLVNYSEMQLNFSRKISRPNHRQIMPFIMFADRQSYSTGNPALAPEFVNLAEWNYNYPIKKGNIFNSIYGRFTEDIITQYVYPLASDSTILVNTFINGKNSQSLGWEGSVKYNIVKPLDITLSGNMNYFKIEAAQGNESLKNSGLNWSGKILVNYKLMKDLNLQVNGDYEAPRIIPQGKTIEVYSIDASINKDFGKKVSVNFSVNDIFNTRRFGGIYENAQFYQEFSRRRQTRFFRINLTWKFGETDASLFKRRPAGQRRDPGASGGDSDF